MARSKSKAAPPKSQAAKIRIASANAVAEKKANALVHLGLLPGGAAKKIHAPLKSGTKGLSGKNRYLRRKVNKIFADIGKDQVYSDYKLKPKSDRSRFIKNPTKAQKNALTRAGYKPVASSGGKVFYTEPDKSVSKTGRIVTKRPGYRTRLVQLDEDIIGRDESNPKLLQILLRIYNTQLRAGRPGQIGIYFGINEGNVHNILVRPTPQAMYEYLVTHYEDSTLEKIEGLVILTYDQTIQKSKETGAHIVEAIPRKNKYVKARDLSERQLENRRLKSRIRYAHKKAIRKQNGAK